MAERSGYRRALRRLGREGNRLSRAVRYSRPWLLGRATAPRRFAILTAGRTGSELLVELLNSHPRIVCDSEILATRRWLPHRFLARRAALARLRGAEAYGFKLVREHAVIQDLSDAAEFLRGLAHSGHAIVLIERRDLLQQAISHVRASSSRYHYREGDRVAFAAMRVDPVAVLAYMYSIEDAVAFARAALEGMPCLELVYEDHLSDPAAQQATVDEICRYLGVTPASVRSDLVKITPRTVPEQVENFEELAAVVSRTRFARYVEGAESRSAGP